jgi:hypothetical protein
VLLAFAGESQRLLLIRRPKQLEISRSDVHFWQHGRIGDSMVVTDEVLAITMVIEELKADVFYSKVRFWTRVCW